MPLSRSGLEGPQRSEFGKVDETSFALRILTVGGSDVKPRRHMGFVDRKAQIARPRGEQGELFAFGDENLGDQFSTGLRRGEEAAEVGLDQPCDGGGYCR